MTSQPPASRTTIEQNRMIDRFRVVAYLEAITYLILLAFVVVKRGFHGPDLVRVMGPIHGILFIVYFVMALQVRVSQAWSVGKTILVIVAAAIPFGGFFVGGHLSEDDAVGAG